MRTTLDIDDDVLAAAKELAAGRKTTAGKVLSDLARQALRPPAMSGKPDMRGGFVLLPPTDSLITPEMVQDWLDEEV
jgi:hypothetical protein